ncbi:preprotein translocase subunit YajC [Aureliella helgolandensis]|uniref:Sec translocon accessory complex subunit YajC n=1 Tax=Aureliella helgolandensis TaxID=2527968 RepID=A0A518G244_9BACT|nr:preprotein translocase subunit YajC [Aureliella helgolandensis]QDV22686.1 preprotein translocase subunit YajC [Aureliella helgolandensis]|tara:strand:+ start:727 stop:1182 length:456 start_codon:yes stop_codon:yes gene_type:complete
MKYGLAELWSHSSWLLTNHVWLIGQGDTKVSPDSGADVVGAGADLEVGAAGDMNPIMLFLSNPLNLLLLSAILFMFIVIRPQQKQMKQLQKSLAELKKNDRVVTASGIHGIVVQANAGESVISIRIDENSGARMTVNRDSIAKIINPENKG